MGLIVFICTVIQPFLGLVPAHLFRKGTHPLLDNVQLYILTLLM